MPCTFSGGRDAWKEIESRVMPRNSMEVHGPRVFSFEFYFLTRVDSPECGGVDGGVMMRKLSRR